MVVLVVCLVLVVQSRLLEREKTEGDVLFQPTGPVDTYLPTSTSTPEPTPEPTPELPDLDITSWEFAVANYEQPLGQSFAPDVTETENGQYFDTRAVDALNAFLEGARDAGFEVRLSAAYRPYSTQAYLFYGKASQIAWGGTVEYAEAEEMAKEFVAYPGTSDHQTGLAADILDEAEDTPTSDFGETALGKWLDEHCAEYGFILRYPEGKKDITGFDYEPWHFRYVGEAAAQFIMDKSITLEEFADLYA
jgi:D-alanyl-D-alanine carboxypeptidase